jgi:long-chain acyl-CoA synthetase
MSSMQEPTCEEGLAGLFERIAAHALHQPDQIALRAVSVELSYAALWKRLQSLIEVLNGVRCLALVGDNGPEWVCMDLAARAAGVCVLPIPPFFTQAQVQHALAVTHADALWANDAAQLNDAGQPLVMGYLKRLPNVSWSTPIPSGIAKLTFTSGTTGTPKGVALTQAAMEAVVQSLDAVLNLGSTHTHLSVLPLGVLLENLAGVDLTLWMGGTVVLPALAEVGMEGSSRFHADRFAQALLRWQPNSLILTPQLLQALIAVTQAHPQIANSLRFVAVGGATVSPYLLQQADALGLPVYEGYGLSEMSSVVSLNTPKARRIGSVGRLLPHVQMSFALEQQQILLQGPSMFSGYLDASGTFLPADPVFATGDQGALDAEGYLSLSGRLKHQFITAYGRNVAPEWVERELSIEPEILQALVVGESKPHNLALLVGQSNASVQQIACAVDRANARLPDYAQVRDWIVLEMPFTVENGLWTGTDRPRRALIEAQYHAAIEQAYALFPEQSGAFASSDFKPFLSPVQSGH